MADDDFLGNVGLFLEFDREELDHLRGSLVATKFQPGDVILQEGNANRALHIVRSGRIRVSRTVHNRDVSLCDLVGGQTFGELSIIEDGVASASLEAVTETEYCRSQWTTSLHFCAPGQTPRPNSGGKSQSTSAVGCCRPTTSSAAISRSIAR